MTTPATDQVALRDRIAEALATTDGWVFADGFREISPTFARYQQKADAVLSVLPAPTEQSCICTHTAQQHFEDACLVCGCGDYLVPEAAREVIDRLHQAVKQRDADRATAVREAAGTELCRGRVVIEEYDEDGLLEHSTEAPQSISAELRRLAGEARQDPTL